MADLWQDLRFGMRMLMKNPWFTLLAIVTLTLGIGANTAIFSVIDAVLLRPLPYREADRLVTLWQNNTKVGVTRNDASPANFLDWQEQSRSFEAMAGIEPYGFTLIGNDEPERFRAWLVTKGFFEVLGVNAFRGRTFTPLEYQSGNDRVIIVSYDLWQRRFGGDPTLIGRKLTMNGRPFEVVGVMPPQFQFPLGRDIWSPRATSEADRQLRGSTYWNVIARLKPGVTEKQAQDEISAVAARLEQQYPETNGGMGAALVPLSELLTGQVRRVLWLLFGAVGCILLIACANVANLLLVRSAERQRDLAICSALGASPLRLLRQLLTESLLLACLGGAGGLLLSMWGVKLIRSFTGGRLPRLDQAGINLQVLLFVGLISVLTAVIFGLLPAFQSSRPDIQTILKEEGSSTIGGTARHWLRNSLVPIEVALALVLLTGAGLLVRSFINLQQIAPGFAPEKLLTLQVFLSRNYQKPDQITDFFTQALEKVTEVPGVRAVAVAADPPFINLEQTAPFIVKGHAPSVKGQEPSAYYNEVSAEYLNVMGIPLLRGRFFSKFDKSDAAQVIVINETMARRHFPNEDPIGKKLTVLYNQPVTREIVGVIGNVLNGGLDGAARPEILVPHLQSPTSQMTFVVKTSVEPTTFLPAIKTAIRLVNANQTFAQTMTMNQLISDSLRPQKFNLFLLGSFAVLAITLAASGIYGVISQTTRQRVREVGVRIALGASRGDILKLLIRQGLTPTLLGIVLGLIASLGLMRLMKGMLFGVSTTDPLTFALIAIIIMIVATLATYLPARKAVRIDPVTALRSE